MDTAGVLYAPLLPTKLQAEGIKLAESAGPSFLMTRQTARLVFGDKAVGQRTEAESLASVSASDVSSGAKTIVISDGRIIAEFKTQSGRQREPYLQRQDSQVGDIVLLSWGAYRFAYHAPQAALFLATTDPWTGEPIIASTDGQVWSGVSGRSLVAGSGALRPYVTHSLGADERLSTLNRLR